MLSSLEIKSKKYINSRENYEGAIFAIFTPSAEPGKSSPRNPKMISPFPLRSPPGVPLIQNNRKTAFCHFNLEEMRFSGFWPNHLMCLYYSWNFSENLSVGNVAPVTTQTSFCLNFNLIALLISPSVCSKVLGVDSLRSKQFTNYLLTS